jgi:hypothetical protein
VSLPEPAPLVVEVGDVSLPEPAPLVVEVGDVSLPEPAPAGEGALSHAKRPTIAGRRRAPTRSAPAAAFAAAVASAEPAGASAAPADAEADAGSVDDWERVASPPRDPLLNPG